MLRTGYFAAAAGGAGGPAFERTDLVQSASVSSLVTFNSVNIGEPAADRYVIVCANTRSGSSNNSQTTCNINGVSATRLSYGEGSGSTQSVATAIWIALVPTGTSVTITVSTNNSNRASLGVYRATGLESSAARSSGNDWASDSSAVSFNLTRVEGGIMLATISTTLYQTNAQTTHTWTGITNDYELYTTGSTHSASGALDLATPAGSVTIRCQPSRSTGRHTACGVVLL